MLIHTFLHMWCKETETVLARHEIWFRSCLAWMLAPSEQREYRMATLRRKLKRQLLSWPGIYDMGPIPLLRAIDTAVQGLYRRYLIFEELGFFSGTSRSPALHLHSHAILSFTSLTLPPPAHSFGRQLSTCS